MKEIKHSIKMSLTAGQAFPRPPISTVLGPTNININKFCDDFNI